MDVAGFMPGETVLSGICKDIEAYEAQRTAAERQVRWRVPVFVGAAILVVALIAWLFNGLADPYEQWLSTPHLFLYVLGLIAAIGAYFVAMWPAARAKQSFRDRLLPIVFGFIEDVHYRHGETPDSFDRLPAVTLGSFNRQRFDDFFSGRYEGFPFELYEAKLTNKSGKTSSTIFRGVIVAFAVAAPFPGTLVATRETGAVIGFFRNIFGDDLQELTSGVPELEAYEFRTDNPQAAQPLVRGRLAKALAWLNQRWLDGQARVALSKGDGFQLLPNTKNFFELPPISTPLNYHAHVEPMIAEMAALLATAALVRKVAEEEPE